MNLGSVHHVSLNVADLDAATAFYHDTLGLPAIERPDLGFPGTWLQAGDQELHLIPVQNHQAPEGQHFAFRVDDVAAAAAELRDRGVRVSEPREVPGVCRQCFLRDPSGNLLELNQPMK